MKSKSPTEKIPQKVRYTEQEKKEIIDFVQAHNAAKGRGGVSQAVKKFKVSPITINSWLVADAPTEKKAKPAKEAKETKSAKEAKPAKASVKKAVSKKASTKKKAAAKDEVVEGEVGGENADETVSMGVGEAWTGVRYPKEFKQEVVKFVNDYNRKNGRGGQSRAASQYKLSVLTVAKWVSTMTVDGKPGRLSPAEKELAALKAALRKLLA